MAANMKVIVCFDHVRVVVPCGYGDMSVTSLIDLAVARYRKAIGKTSDYWITVHSLKSLDGGILDQDDRIADVVDDREQIIAIFEEQDGRRQQPNGGDGTSTSSVGTASPDIFQDVKAENALNAVYSTQLLSSDVRIIAPPSKMSDLSELTKNFALMSTAEDDVNNNDLSSDNERTWNDSRRQVVVGAFRPFARATSRKSLANNTAMLNWLDAQERLLDKNCAAEKDVYGRSEPIGSSDQADPEEQYQTMIEHSDDEENAVVAPLPSCSGSVILLENNGSPLGIHVVPDVDSVGRNVGLIIQNIEPQGRVQRDGRLRVNDRIIAINGNSLVGLDFHRAQDIFKEALQSPFTQLNVIFSSDDSRSLLAPVQPPCYPPPPLTVPYGSSSRPPLYTSRKPLPPEPTCDPASDCGSASYEPNTSTPADKETSKEQQNEPTSKTPTNKPPKRAGSCTALAGGAGDHQQTPPTLERRVVIPGPVIHTPLLQKQVLLTPSRSVGTLNTMPPASCPAGPLTSGTASCRSKFLPIHNTRTLGSKLEIQLIKGPQGLGFSLTTRDNQAGGNCPMYIKTILPQGAAINDGRLQPGDRLLEVNGILTFGKTQEEIVNYLRRLPLGSAVDLIVSRLDNVDEQQKKGTHGASLSNVDDDDMDILVFIITLGESGTESGLGISVKGKTAIVQDKTKTPFSQDSGSQDLGLFVKAVVDGGAAAKDGRLRPDDQLLEVNGFSLFNLTNLDAMNALRQAMQQEGPEAGTVSLVIARQKFGFGRPTLVPRPTCNGAGIDSITNSSSKLHQTSSALAQDIAIPPPPLPAAATAAVSTAASLMPPPSTNKVFSTRKRQPSLKLLATEKQEILSASNQQSQVLTAPVAPVADSGSGFTYRNMSYQRATHDSMIGDGTSGPRSSSPTPISANVTTTTTQTVAHVSQKTARHIGDRAPADDNTNTEHSGEKKEPSTDKVGSATSTPQPNFSAPKTPVSKLKASSEMTDADNEQTPTQLDPSLASMLTMSSPANIDPSKVFNRDGFGRKSVNEKRKTKQLSFDHQRQLSEGQSQTSTVNTTLKRVQSVESLLSQSTITSPRLNRREHVRESLKKCSSLESLKVPNDDGVIDSKCPSTVIKRQLPDNLAPVAEELVRTVQAPCTEKKSKEKGFFKGLFKGFGKSKKESKAPSTKQIVDALRDDDPKENLKVKTVTVKVPPLEENVEAELGRREQRRRAAMTIRSQSDACRKQQRRSSVDRLDVDHTVDENVATRGLHPVASDDRCCQPVLRQIQDYQDSVDLPYPESVDLPYERHGDCFSDNSADYLSYYQNCHELQQQQQFVHHPPRRFQHQRFESYSEPMSYYNPPAASTSAAGTGYHHFMSSTDSLHGSSGCPCCSYEHPVIHRHNHYGDPYYGQCHEYYDRVPAAAGCYGPSLAGFPPYALSQTRNVSVPATPRHLRTPLLDTRHLHHPRAVSPPGTSRKVHSNQQQQQPPSRPKTPYCEPTIADEMTSVRLRSTADGVASIGNRASWQYPVFENVQRSSAYPAGLQPAVYSGHRDGGGTLPFAGSCRKRSRADELASLDDVESTRTGTGGSSGLARV